jgi:hypothetical protein
VAIRARKNALVVLVKTHLLARRLTAEEASGFELMYRRARSEREQDEVTKALHFVLEGWKDAGAGGAAGGAFAHLQRLRAGIDLYSAKDDEDDDPPGLKAALARSRVDLRRRA